MKNLAAQSPSLANPVTETFLASLDRAVHASCPYDYWLLNNSLPDETCAAIEALPIAPPTGLVYDGTRDANNSVRSYFAPKERALFPVCEQVTQTFSDPEVLAALEDVSGAKLMGSQLRIEYTQDITGFWLVPHPDLAVKVFTMLIYLSDDPALADAGTDIFDATEEHNYVASAPYERGAALIFVPGKTTYHGFRPRPIQGVRTSLIVNYVTQDWRAKQELCFPPEEV